jgi:hypothetical protein
VMERWPFVQSGFSAPVGHHRDFVQDGFSVMAHCPFDQNGSPRQWPSRRIHPVSVVAHQHNKPVLDEGTACHHGEPVLDEATSHH